MYATGGHLRILPTTLTQLCVTCPPRFFGSFTPRSRTSSVFAAGSALGFSPHVHTLVSSPPRE